MIKRNLRTMIDDDLDPEAVLPLLDDEDEEAEDGLGEEEDSEDDEEDPTMI